MLPVQFIILAVLLAIFAQDARSLSVYWFLFLILGILLLILRFLAHEPVHDIWFSSVVNLILLVLQFLLVSLYFSARAKTWVNITRQLLGWGDILFLISIAFYLSPLIFFAFYLLSLAIILIFWLAWQILFAIKEKSIPLAGLQAVVFALFLAVSWWLLHLDLTSDNALLAIVYG